MKKRAFILLVLVLTMLCSTVFASAAQDPAVTIVNPEDQVAVYSDSLLISVKVTQPKTIQISVSEKKQTVGNTYVSFDVNKLMEQTTQVSKDSLRSAKSVDVCPEEKFTCSNNLSFFTKKVSDLTPGVYEVKVKTLNGAGQVTYSSSSLVALMGKQSAEDQANIIDKKENGAIKFFKDLFNSIFK